MNSTEMGSGHAFLVAQQRTGTFSLDFGRTFLISANTASTCVNEKEKKTYSVDIRRLASANK